MAVEYLENDVERYGNLCTFKVTQMPYESPGGIDPDIKVGSIVLVENGYDSDTKFMNVFGIVALLYSGTDGV